MIVGPFVAEGLIFGVRGILVSSNLTDPNQGFCSAVWALTCSFYAILDTFLLGLFLVISALVWWLITIWRRRFL